MLGRYQTSVLWPFREPTVQLSSKCKVNARHPRSMTPKACAEINWTGQNLVSYGCSVTSDKISKQAIQSTQASTHPCFFLLQEKGSRDKVASWLRKTATRCRVIKTIKLLMWTVSCRLQYQRLIPCHRQVHHWVLMRDNQQWNFLGEKKKRNCSTLNFWYFSILIHRWANPVHTRPTEMCNFSLGSCLASAEYCRETHRAPATDLLKLTYFQNCLSWTFPISSVKWLSLENPPENEINAPEENMLLAAVHVSVVPALRFPPLYKFQEATALPRFYDMLHTL